MLLELLFANGFETLVYGAIIKYPDRTDLFYQCTSDMHGGVHNLDCEDREPTNIEVPAGSGDKVVLHVRAPDFDNEKRCEKAGGFQAGDSYIFYYICPN